MMFPCRAVKMLCLSNEESGGTVRSSSCGHHPTPRQRQNVVVQRAALAGVPHTPAHPLLVHLEPKELSMSRVKDCHLCILLVGFRLGHVPTGEKRSIIQMER